MMLLSMLHRPASNNISAVAVATFKLSTPCRMGMLTSVLHAAATGAVSPRVT